MIHYVQTMLVIVLLFMSSVSASAEFDWVTFTLDNDLFLSTDDGYTNGLYVSLFDTGDNSGSEPSNDIWVHPLLWSMPEASDRNTINAYMLGQIMVTPSDITVAEPEPNEIPYSALLALNNSFVSYTDKVADQVSTTIGIVGPAALGEPSQKLVHKIIGSDEPKGWDTQLGNELVFQFSRARAWRSWVSISENMDIVSNGELSLGLIASNVSLGTTFRYGKGLAESYVTTLYNNSRMLNPSAINRGWYLYSRIQVGYLFNQIYTDGNTFRRSDSIDYVREYIELGFGLAYSTDTMSLSFTVADFNILQRADADALENLTQYGSLTFAWRL